MVKKLFVTDLDDTLVKNGEKLSKHTIKELNRIFNDQEKELIIASARSYDGIIKRIRGLSKKIKIIARNGSIIYDEDSNIIYFANMLKDEVERSIKYSIDRGLCPVIVDVINNKEFFYIDKRYINNTIIKYSKELNFIYSNDLQNEKFSNVIGIYSFGEIKNEEKYIINGLKIIKDEEFIHIIGQNVSKGYALEKLSNIYKYKDIICFGNDENDYSMLDFCNKPYFIFIDNENKKYNNLPFDNGKSILEIMEKNK